VIEALQGLSRALGLRSLQAAGAPCVRRAAATGAARIGRDHISSRTMRRRCFAPRPEGQATPCGALPRLWGSIWGAFMGRKSGFRGMSGSVLTTGTARAGRKRAILHLSEEP
jgi:hypothetical protein